MASHAERIAKLAAATKRFHGLLEVLEQTAKHAEERRGEYRTMHWGDPGKNAARGLTVPDVSEGVTMMGRLVQIAYVTRKGPGRPVEEFVHDFDAPYPILGVAPEGSRKGLVVVRDASKYSVSWRGIVG